MLTQSKRNSKFMILPIVIIALCLFGWFGFKYFEPISVDAFLPALERYEELSQKHENSVIVPGAKSNSVRIELDAILNKILTAPMEDTVRGKYSVIALEKLDELDRQIALSYDIGETVNIRIEGLITAGESISGAEVRMLVEDIIVLTQKQKNVIDEIEILTRVITDRTRGIFERVLEEGGGLTNEHMISLNEQIGEAETQFDKRAFLFAEMAGHKMKIEHLSIQLRSLAYKD